MKKKYTHSKTLLIGSGRLAKHISYYCHTLNWKIHPKIPVSMRRLHLESAESVPHLYHWSRKHKLQSLLQALDEFDQIWLAIADSAIQDFVRAHLQSFRGKIFHFSGALEVPGTLSVHPLMTFAKKLYPPDIYPKILWVHTTHFSWQTHFPGFSNKHVQIQPEHKIVYHLLCVMLGNFTQILFNTVLEQFLRIGINKNNLSLYIQKNLENQYLYGWDGLTGPFARDDQSTIRSHLNILSRNQPNSFFSPARQRLFKKIYLDFQSLYQHRKSK